VNALLAFKHANSDPWAPCAPGGCRPAARPLHSCAMESGSGLTCDSTNRSVVALVSWDTGPEHIISASVWGPHSAPEHPPQFSSLTALTALDLSYLGAYKGLTMGGLVGSIPSELGRCTKPGEPQATLESALGVPP